jgi:hypothetical protein
LNGKMHLTSLSLLDIVSHSVASWFELAGADRTPGRPAVPGVPEPPSSFHLYQAEEEGTCDLFCYLIIELFFPDVSPRL